MHKCEKCGKEFKRYYKSYLNHINSCEVKQKVYSCKICGKEFEQPSAIGGHMATAHGNVNKKKNYECKICGEIFYTNKGAFENHVKNHDEAFKSNKSERIKVGWNRLMNDKQKSKDLSEFRSRYMKDNNPMYKQENIEKMKESQREYLDNLTEEEYSKVVENFINAPKKGNAIEHSGKYTPTKIEQMVIDLNIEGLEYNGNKKNSRTIRFKNKNFKHSLTPDFIYKDNKKLIETFGIYWHAKEDEEIYKNACRENGYEVLILWEDELYSNFENCKVKIYEFLQI